LIATSAIVVARMWSLPERVWHCCYCATRCWRQLCCSCSLSILLWHLNVGKAQLI